MARPSNWRVLAEIVSRFLWAATAWGALIGAVNYVFGNPSSAPQQAALAAVSLLWIIGPYVLARAWDELTRPAWRMRAERPAESKAAA